MESEYAIGQHKYEDKPSDFEKNTLTTSQIRFNRMLAAFEVPEAQLEEQHISG